MIAQASRVIPASAGDLFELLAHPSQHSLIDGSGTVRDIEPRAPWLLWLIRAHRRNQQSIEQTLLRMDEWARLQCRKPKV